MDTIIIKQTDFQFVVDGYSYYVDSEGEVWIVGIPSLDGAVVIPEKVDFEGAEYIVTKIGVDLEDSEWADNDNDEDDGVFDDDVDEETDIDDIEDDIDDESPVGFFDNEGITSISFPNSVSFIGAETIMSCSKLRLVGIGKGIKHIEANAISGCDALEAVIVFKSKDEVSIHDKAFQNNAKKPEIIFVKSRLLTVLLNCCHMVLCALGIYFSFPFLFLGFIKPIGRGITSFIRRCASQIKDRFTTTLNVLSLSWDRVWEKVLLNIVIIILVGFAEVFNAFTMVNVGIVGGFYAVILRFLRKPIFNATRGLFDNCASLFNIVSANISFGNSTPIILKIGSVVLQIIRHAFATLCLFTCMIYVGICFLYALVFKCLKKPIKNAVSLCWRRMLLHIKGILNLLVLKQPEPIKVEIEQQEEDYDEDEMDMRPRKKDGSLDMRYSVNQNI